MPEGSDITGLHDRIRAVLAETLGVAAAEVDDDASSDTLAGWDSLAHQNLLLALSKAFAVTFSAEEGDGLQDFQSIARTIAAKLAAGAPAPKVHGAPTSAARAETLPPPVVVISDSNARTFSYHPAFLPLCIGQGAKTNLLTAENARYVEEKIATLLPRLPAEAVIALALPGTYMHHFRNTFGTRSGDAAAESALLADRAAATAMLAQRLQAAARQRIVVLAVAPLAAAGYALGCAQYNGALKTACARHGIGFIDVPPALAEANGAPRPEYWADTWHVHPRAAALYLDALRADGIVTATRAGDGDGGWAYRYLFPMRESMLDIWGDFPADDLVLDPPDADFALSAAGITHAGTFRWDRYHLRTNFIADCVAAMAPTFLLWQATQNRPLDVTILDCREGFAAFAWELNGTGRIRGIDRSALAIARANELKALAGKDTVVFKAVARLDALSVDEATDVIVALERTAYTDEFLGAFFAKLRALSRLVFFLSDAGDSHARLMRNAGFAAVIEVPIIPMDGPMHMPASRKVMGGRKVETTGYHLLAGFAEDPGAAVRRALRDYLSAQKAMQTHRAAGAIAALLDPMIAALAEKG